MTGWRVGWVGGRRAEMPEVGPGDPGCHIPSTVKHMSTYSGPARLILADGTRVPGTASLKMNQHGRSPGWGGTFRPDQTTAATREATDGLQIELPYEVGEVRVIGTRSLLATQILMSLTGHGPAPF